MSLTKCQGPIPPRSKPYAIGFEVSPDKKRLRAHCVRLETYEIRGAEHNDTEFTLLNPDIHDERIGLLATHVGSNWHGDALKRLAWISKQLELTIRQGYDECDSPWEVGEMYGNVNDRSYRVLGEGKTFEEALDKAMLAKP